MQIKNKDCDFMNKRRKKLIEQYYQNKIENIELLIDNVWDPHNVSAVARTADGLGIRTINLYYTYNEFPKLNKVGKKTSASANKWMNFVKVTNLLEFAVQKKSEGFQFFAADIGPTAHLLNHFCFPDKCIIIMGSESSGMSTELKEICDGMIYIPMAGMVASYNISVAAAIILYEVFRQKGHTLCLRSGDDFHNNRNQAKRQKNAHHANVSEGE
ncbi:MAG: RNA methyltransferase [SAR324 cluster bacterium]|nr:RNA methyltransferase [SAR324 cluster bacterium]